MSIKPPEKAWNEAANALHKVFEFESFGQALAFMSSAAPLIEAMNHHPDLDIRWRTPAVPGISRRWFFTPSSTERGGHDKSWRDRSE